jgi:hypothetical protein
MKEFIEGTSPINALDKFHKSIQLTSGISHKDYKIISLGLVYNLDPTGGCKLDNVESRYDVPTSPNPDLQPEAVVKKEKEVTMAFMDGLQSGRLAP